MSPVPLLDLNAQYTSIAREIQQAVQNVIASQRFILGPEVAQLEQEIAQYVGCQFAVGVSSGTDALMAALLALDIQPGDEVITTGYSFFATAGAIVRVGARPVFVDIDPATYNIDPAAVAAQVTPRTRAIVPVHLFGRCAAIPELKAAAPGIPLVEDAAQALGAILGGKKAGQLGTLGCFSFFPSKNLGGYGDGGMVTTNDADLAQRLKAIRVHGRFGHQPYLHDLVGGNFRLDAIQAAVLRVKLPHLENWTQRRRENAAAYRRFFQQAQAQVELPPEDAPHCRDVYNQFVIRTPRRDDLAAHLKEQGIGHAIYYPRGLHQQPCFARWNPPPLPHCEKASQETLALPVYPELAKKQLEEIVDCVTTFLKS